jgi:hypothetical protein
MSFILAVMMMSVAVPTDRWIPVSGSEGPHRDYLDRHSIQRNGHKVTLWTRRDFAGQQRILWHEIEIDCAAKMDTIIAWVEDNAGAVTHNVHSPHRPSATIPPGSLGQTIFDLVCR